MTEHAQLLSGVADPALVNIVNRWASDRMLAVLTLYKRQTGRSILHHFVGTAQHAELQVVLQMPPPFLLRKVLDDVSNGVTPLGLAAGHGDVFMVQSLLAAGASPLRIPGELVPPMIQAVRGGHIEVVRLFKVHRTDLPVHEALHALALANMDDGRWNVFVNVAGRSNPNTPNAVGKQALLFAIESHLPRCATWLMWRFPAIDVNNGLTPGVTVPLFAAARKGQTHVVAALLNSRSALDVGWVDINGRGVLHIALRGGHQAVVAMLLADPRVSVTSNASFARRPLVHTAMHYAINTHRPDLLRQLALRPDVDWSAMNQYGQTAICRLIRHTLPRDHANSDVLTCMSILLAHAPDSVDTLNIYGNNALVECVEHGWSGEVLLQLLQGSKQFLSQFVLNHPTLLHTAAKKGLSRVCWILRASGYLHTPDTDGNHPDEVAMLSGHDLLGVRLRETVAMPPLQWAFKAGINTNHVNHAIAIGDIDLVRPLPWIKLNPCPQPAGAVPLVYLQLLNASRAGWSRKVHLSFSSGFCAGVWAVLLSQLRLGALGLPIEMCHLIFAQCARGHFE